jgi:hypothetical protein
LRALNGLSSKRLNRPKLHAVDIKHRQVGQDDLQGLFPVLAPIKRWRRRRIIECAPFAPALWLQTMARCRFLRRLDSADLSRLRDSVILFLHEKSIHGAAGLELEPTHAAPDCRTGLFCSFSILTSNTTAGGQK